MAEAGTPAGPSGDGVEAAVRATLAPALDALATGAARAAAAAAAAAGGSRAGDNAEALSAALTAALVPVVVELKEVAGAMRAVQAATAALHAAATDQYNITVFAHNQRQLADGGGSDRGAVLLPPKNAAGKLPPPGMFPGTAHDLQTRVLSAGNMQASAARMSQILRFYGATTADGAAYPTQEPASYTRSYDAWEELRWQFEAFFRLGCPPADKVLVLPLGHA